MDQYLITSSMAQCVVDLLEPIEVNVQYSGGRIVRAGLEKLVEFAAVCETS